jgi:anti-sigma regulatory factor (Ser/Thr protein kinase)
MLIEDVRWFRIEHDSAIGAARRAAAELAGRLGLGDQRAHEIGIAVTEVASNQIKHAGGGVLLLRACRSDGDCGVELVAYDSGPGILDLPEAMTDGRSTSGTLGIGLGAVARLASSWDLYSMPGRGTVIAAGFGPCETATCVARAAGLTRPMSGQDVCGDAYALRTDGDTVTAMMADGLGHGPLAAAASGAAVRSFLDAPAGSPVTLLTGIHRALSGTRGAAVAVAQLTGDGQARYAGVGNISGHILDGQRHRGLMSHPGIAGSNARTLRETVYEVPGHATIVLHSDGISEKLGFADHTGLLGRAPLVVAATLLRDFGMRNDDAGMLVLGPPAR